MHSLVDRNMVETIRTTGNASAALPDRKPLLEKHGLPYDRPAENVIVTGCQILPALPRIIRTLADIFDRKGLSYTFLSKEYCCGNLIYRPAVKARDEAALAECRELSKEFVAGNIDQTKDLGAKRLIIFCSPCYPIYKHAFPEENIVFYPAVLDELMEESIFEGAIDYYAGCYRLHRKFSPVPMDLKSTDRLLGKVRGLDVNRISAPKCCYHPEGLAHMVQNVQTKLMLHICTGCYTQAVKNIPQDQGTEVLMLPEFVKRVMEA